MGRQLFLHHYLPAHLASALVAGALIEFIFNVEPMSAEEIDAQKKKERGIATVVESFGRPVRERIYTGSLYGAWAATAAIYAALIGGFLFFAPLTYGTPGLSVDEVLSRKWLSYDLHFAK
jgi:dolichyl-phosphate-mannose-protein mannosyltransferase